jgi:hypothetical protein
MMLERTIPAKELDNEDYSLDISSSRTVFSEWKSPATDERYNGDIA